MLLHLIVYSRALRTQGQQTKDGVMHKQIYYKYNNIFTQRTIVVETPL